MRNEVPGAGQPHAAGLRQRIELVLSHPGPQPDVGAPRAATRCRAPRAATRCGAPRAATRCGAPRAATRCGGTQGRNQMVFSEGGKLIVTFRCTIFGGTKCCIEQLKIYLKICEGGKFARLRAWGNFFAFGVRMKCGLSLCCVWTLHVFRIRKRYKPGSIAK